jgi:hypothetical protein
MDYVTWMSGQVQAAPLMGIDIGDAGRQTICAARANADGSIEILGICDYTGDADSDGGECD